jgi:hypothetical protein
VFVVCTTSIVGSRQGLYRGVTSGFILWGHIRVQTTIQQWPNWNFWYQNQVHTKTCFPIGQLDNLSNCLAYHWTIKDESHWMTGYLMWPKIEGYQMLVYHQKKLQQTLLYKAQKIYAIYTTISSSLNQVLG